MVECSTLAKKFWVSAATLLFGVLCAVLAYVVHLEVEKLKKIEDLQNKNTDAENATITSHEINPDILYYTDISVLLTVMGVGSIGASFLCFMVFFVCCVTGIDYASGENTPNSSVSPELEWRPPSEENQVPEEENQVPEEENQVPEEENQVPEEENQVEIRLPAQPGNGSGRSSPAPEAVLYRAGRDMDEQICDENLPGASHD